MHADPSFASLISPHTNFFRPCVLTENESSLEAKYVPAEHANSSTSLPLLQWEPAMRIQSKIVIRIVHYALSVRPCQREKEVDKRGSPDK